MSNKLIGIFLSVSILLFVFDATSVSASVEGAIKKYAINFPIAELGNCNNFSECRNYCEKASNRTACISYAKNKGFYKEEEINQKKDEIISEAQNELGCSSVSACKSFCGNEENFEKCTEFAKKHGLGGGQMLSPKNQDILNKAKSTLGCDSPSTCKALCSQDSNMEKCKNFFQSVGLKVEEGSKKGPGGCNSPESCEAYCSDKAHAAECEAEGEDPTGKSTKRKDAIKACENLGPEECKNYCMQNPNDCPGFWAEGGYKGPDYGSGEDYCEKNSGACPGMGAEDETKKQIVQGISTAKNFLQMIVEYIKSIR